MRLNVSIKLLVLDTRLRQKLSNQTLRLLYPFDGIGSSFLVIKASIQ
jgi:hypothetical protein